MKKLNSSIRVAELDAASDALTRLWGEAGLTDDAFLTGAFAELSRLSDEITAAIKRDRATSDLDEADSKRDEAVRSLAAMLEGYAAFPIPEKKAAGQALKAVFDRYGRKITGESFAAESSLIESLLGDFAAAGTSKLEGIAEQIAVLRDAENSFKAAYDRWMKSLGSEAQKASATGVKKPLVALINEKIVPYLSAMQVANAERYGGFASAVERELERANAVVAGRK